MLLPEYVLILIFYSILIFFSNLKKSSDSFGSNSEMLKKKQYRPTFQVQVIVSGYCVPNNL